MNSSHTKMCGVLLAGGKSSRMGENKAFLDLRGRTFLDIQIEKLCRPDIDEILISGESGILATEAEKTYAGRPVRIIPDIIKEKGPLGGLYSCFSNTDCTTALVITVDVPLISSETLGMLIRHHTQNKDDATVLAAASHIEPLIAVYNTCLKSDIRELIDRNILSVRSLLDRISTYYLSCDLHPSELYNCNSPDDYVHLKQFS